jgi:hypothetical protein
MDPIEQVIRRLDATQQRLPPAAFVFGVVKKSGRVPPYRRACPARADPPMSPGLLGRLNR